MHISLIVDLAAGDKAKGWAFHWSLVSTDLASFEARAGCTLNFSLITRTGSLCFHLEGSLSKHKGQGLSRSAASQLTWNLPVCREAFGSRRHSKKIENVSGSLVWTPAAQILSVSLPGPVLSLPSQDTYSDLACPCFLLPTRDIWFPASFLGGCKTSSSWDISCFPPSPPLKIAIGINTGRHMGLQPPLTAH